MKSVISVLLLFEDEERKKKKYKLSWSVGGVHYSHRCGGCAVGAHQAGAAAAEGEVVELQQQQ